MNTRPTTSNSVSQSDIDLTRKLGKTFRSLVMALMLFGGAFSVGYADHMGNHQRGPSDSTGLESGYGCGSDVVKAPPTTDDDESSFSRGGRPW